MELQPLLPNILISLTLIGVCSLFLHVLNVLWLEPERLRSKLRRQGIRGPPPSSFLLGNIPDLKASSTLLQSPGDGSDVSETTAYSCSPATLFPFYEHCRKKYGPTFMFSLGNMQVLLVNQPDQLKEISHCTSLDFGKPSYLQKLFGHMFGQGVISSNGAIWAHQKKIIAPELHMDKIKGMVNLMVESANSLLTSWKLRIEIEGGIGDITIDEDLRIFSGDVISRACFGSSYSKGKEIFLRLRALQEATAKRGYNFGVPGLSYLPTKINRDIWRLEKEIRSLILKTTKEQEVREENDLLQKILQVAKSSDLKSDTINKFIVDNCKSMYLAGYETTAVSATWSMMLLASHPEWQARVRAEILEVCGGQLPDAAMLRRMKLLTMVIQEVLRLYPPVPTFAREALQDIQFGDLHVPKGVHLWVSIITLNHDPDFWGPDANKFNPERFSNGTNGACNLPYLYMPFGTGPRICLGQNFAMVELKILLTLILSNFSLSLSPKYRHSPKHRLLLEAEHGVDLLIKRV